MTKDPIVSIELFLFTGDGCEQLTTYPVNHDGSLGQVKEGEWSGEPEAETQGGSITLVRASGAQLEHNISGSDHRDLEDTGEGYEALFTRLIAGEEFPAALAAATTPPPRKAPRRR